jgi:hypothetical protein
LIEILEQNFWKEILRTNSEKKEISGYGEGNYFLGVETLVVIETRRICQSSPVTPVKSLVTLCARINETMKQVNLVRFLVRIDKR